MRTAALAARSKPVTRARPEHPLHEVQLNLRVRGLAPSATVAINDRSNELRTQGKEIFKLGLGQSPFPVPSPVVEALRRTRRRESVSAGARAPRAQGDDCRAPLPNLRHRMHG